MKTIAALALIVFVPSGLMASSMPLAEVTVEIDDLVGNPISSIDAGSDFLIKVTVQDVRVPPDPISGIFSAYLNVSFDNTLAMIGPLTTPVFGPTFQAYGVGASYGLSSIGTTSTVAAGSFSSSLTNPGNAPQLLYKVQAHAAAPGIETFSPSVATQLGFDFLFYNPIDPVTAADIQFVGATLTIVPEPSSWVLLGNGCVFAAVATIRRRRTGVRRPAVIRPTRLATC